MFLRQLTFAPLLAHSFRSAFLNFAHLGFSKKYIRIPEENCYFCNFCNALHSLRLKIYKRAKMKFLPFCIIFTHFIRVCLPQTASGNTSCPSGCDCRIANTVRCVSQLLREVPPNMAPNTLVFDFRYNKIRRLPAGVFRPFTRVHTLLLNNNDLEVVEDRAFDGLRSLRTLHLQHNSVRRLDASTLQHLTSLHTLLLHNNQLATIDPRAFEHVPQLKRLEIQRNLLRSFPFQAIESLRSLEQLRLDANHFQCDDCALASLVDFLKQKPTLEVANAADCAAPEALRGERLRQLTTGRNAFSHCNLPQIIEQPPASVGVRPGQTVYLPCKARGALQIVWMYNETMIDAMPSKNEHYQVMNDGTLMIMRARETVEGYYECMAKSATGVVRTRRALVRYERHETHSIRFTRQPDDIIEANEGQDVQMECDAHGYPPPLIHWSKDGRPLSDSGRGPLRLRNVSSRDTGTYICTATNAQQSVTAEGRLFVKSAPEFTLTPVDQDAIAGTKVTMRCEARGYPHPVIYWTKDGGLLRQTRDVTLESSNTLLQIYPFLRQSAGLYECRAKNSVGEKKVQASLRVKHSTPPRLTRTPESVTVVIGQTANFQCRATGDPTPRIVWQFDGSPIPTVRGHYEISAQNTLYVNDVTKADEGVYLCQAANEAGAISADATLTVTARSVSPTNSNRRPGGRPPVPVNRQLIEDSVRQATANVDRAINNTREHLYDGRPKSPAELLALFRFPGAQAIELARAREIYEETLRIIQAHVSGGMQFANLSQFSYENILSPAHLQMITELTGCSVHREHPRCNDMCFHGKYRTYDGTCNNLQKTRLGASLTPFKRLAPPIYENGFDTPVGWDSNKLYAGGFRKPNARYVSTLIITSRAPTLTPDPRYSHMLMQWGQFLDHDLDFAILSPSVEQFGDEALGCKATCQNRPPCFNIDFPPSDHRAGRRPAVPCIELERSSAVCGSGETSVFFNKVEPREQINQITSYIDASNVYGSNEDDAIDLRDLFSDHGLLKFDIASHKQKPYLPFNRDHAMDCRRNRSLEHSVHCFWAGDHRANEQLGLLSMHTLWLREHNRIAGVLLQINPHWDGEKIYQEARKIVGALMQHITYSHWLPKILGPAGMVAIGAYKAYDPNVDPSIANEFATAAFRFGHTLIQPELKRLNASFQTIPEGHIALHEAFFAPDRLLNEGGIDPILRGLFASPAKLLRPDQFLNSELTEKLFSKAQFGLDLAALNLQRGRDHAIGVWTTYRRYCNLSAPSTFSAYSTDIPDADVRARLEEAYGHPDNVDLFVGAVSETPMPDARIGPTFVCLLIDQFRRLRDGDRFWYENPGVFTPMQLAEIRRASLAKVLCHSGDDIERVQPDVFTYPGDPNNGFAQAYRPCGEIPDVNLNMWQECCDATCSGRAPTNSEETESENEEENAGGSSRHGASHRYKRAWNGETRDENERIERLERLVTELQSTVNKLAESKSATVNDCILNDGRRKKRGDRWRSPPCQSCECLDGEEIRCKMDAECVT